MKPRPALLLSALVLLAAAAAPTGRQVLDRAVHRQRYQDATLEVKLEKTKLATGKTRTMTMLIYQKVYPQMLTTLVQLESPDEARGISFLTWDYSDPATPDEKWYYLPQINRYQKLDSTQGAKYEDQFGFSQDIFAVDLDAAEHTLLGEEPVDGAPCWKVESVMKNPADYRGVRVLTWVRKDNDLAAQIHAFDGAGKKIRDFKLAGAKQFGKYWQETGGVYTDEVKGRRLTFAILDARFDAGLSDEQFLSAKLNEKAEKMRKEKKE